MLDVGSFVLERDLFSCRHKKLHHLVYKVSFFAHTGTLRLSSEMLFFHLFFSCVVPDDFLQNKQARCRNGYSERNLKEMLIIFFFLKKN